MRCMTNGDGHGGPHRRREEGRLRQHARDVDARGRCQGAGRHQGGVHRERVRLRRYLARVAAARVGAHSSENPAPSRSYQPFVGSTKSLSGHALGAAGVHEAIYSLLMLNNDFLAESANINEIVEESEGMNILTKRHDGGSTRVMSNSFGFGGTNCCLVFDKYTGRRTRSPPPSRPLGKTGGDRLGTRGRPPPLPGGATPATASKCRWPECRQNQPERTRQCPPASRAFNPRLRAFRRRVLAAPLCRRGGFLRGRGRTVERILLSAHCRMQSGGLAARLIAVGALDEPHGSTSTSDAAGVLCSPAREPVVGRGLSWQRGQARARASAAHLKNRCRHRGGRAARTGRERRSARRPSPSCPPRWA